MLLDLPPEIRQDIFINLFRSATIRTDKRDGNDLAVLRVCRHIYNEAAPLVLLNVRIFCDGNAGVIDTLSRMSPAQITQVRHMIVHTCPVGFKLFSGAMDGIPQEDHAPNENTNNEDSSDPEGDDGIRYFHLAAVLGLFPGLQLDLLQVFNGIGGTPYTGHQTTDGFGYLLEADGYQRLWMHATAGEGDAWLDIPSTRQWEKTIMAKFKPHTGWTVRIKLPEFEWESIPESDMWKRAQSASFTLVEDTKSSDDEEEEEEEYEDGYECEDHADILVNRGDADIVVKPDDDENQLLRCIARGEEEESPEFYKMASDALKKLFKDNSWETIKSMDGFDDGSADDYDFGDVAYAKQVA